MIYIYQHMGLGDHFICNGLIRKLIRDDENYIMFVKPHNIVTVSFMYSDLNNMSFIPCYDDDAIEFIRQKPDNNIIIGFHNNMNIHGNVQHLNVNDLTWDEFFYFSQNIDFKCRWDEFIFNRDLISEKNLYEKLNPHNEEYILIHSKGSDGVDRINYDVLDKNIKHIFVEPHTDNMFDWIGLIYGAKEIHCIESSFHHLIDSIHDLNSKLFFHTKKNGRLGGHRFKDIWNII